MVFPLKDFLVDKVEYSSKFSHFISRGIKCTIAEKCVHQFQFNQNLGAIYLSVKEKSKFRSQLILGLVFLYYSYSCCPFPLESSQPTW